MKKEIILAVLAIALVSIFAFGAAAQQERQTDFSKFVNWIWEKFAHMTGFSIGNEPLQIQSNLGLGPFPLPLISRRFSIGQYLLQRLPVYPFPAKYFSLARLSS